MLSGLQREVFFVLNLIFLEFCKERFCFVRYNSGEEDKSDKVREGHETVEYVGACPDGTYREVGADENREDVEPAVGEYGFLAFAPDQVL